MAKKKTKKKKAAAPLPIALQDNENVIERSGRKFELARHRSDFTVINSTHQYTDSERKEQGLELSPLDGHILRVSCSDAGLLDDRMDRFRENHVAHHVYQVLDQSKRTVKCILHGALC